MSRKKIVTEPKTCLYCKKEFNRPKNEVIKIWLKRKYCSRECSFKGKTTWNKGLTKNDHDSIMRYSIKMGDIAKGRTAWNKGLTKETHPSIKIIGEKISETQKGRAINDAQRAALLLGRTWCKGLTKDDDERIAIRAVGTSKALTGRKNPDHSKRMKKYFKENPDKHINAKLAKKSKGNGYTYIEKLLCEYLAEINVCAKFNHRVGSKWVDFAVVDKMIAIEADGEFWHSDIEKEKKRDSYLKERGWEVLHITGSDIVKNPPKCKEMILSALSERSCKLENLH